MKSIWKKSFAVMVAALCVFSAVACGKGANDDDDEDWLPGASHTHVYNPYMTKKQPTCTQKGENLLKCSCGKTRTEEVGRIAHDMSDGVCEVCGAEESKGLRLVLADGGDYYRVAGLGSCTDRDVIIPVQKNNKPVCEIAPYAFSGASDKNCRNITSINIPDTINLIGASAFDQCESLSGIIVDQDNYEYCSVREDLYTKDMRIIVRYAIGKTDTSVSFDEDMIEIGRAAFAGSKYLTNVKVPDYIETIGERAFSGCDVLESVTIGKGVTTIGSAPFASCDVLTDIAVDGKNSAYQSLDGCLYSKDGSILLQYAIGRMDETLIVPEGVTIIGESVASDCRNLKRVEFPVSLTEIQRQAFSSTTVTTVTFAGTKSQWAQIMNKAKGNNWSYQIGAVYVVCSDGNGNLS